jgi:homocysteine S-methyltransferase
MTKQNLNSLFYDWLENETPILADGAMGTVLHGKGIGIEACFDELNISNPDLVAEVHQSYIDAGAQIIETNTFGANRYKLSSYGLEDRLVEINTAAVQIAKKAVQEASGDVLVAGSVGPLGVRIAPIGRVKAEEAFESFQEHISALVKAGVDLIILETQNDLQEALIGVRAARSLTDLPVIATMTFTRDDRTLLGDSPAHVARQLHQSGADVIGANCSEGPTQLLRILHKMRQAVPEATYSVMPNAGWPERILGRIIYPATPDYFAEYAIAFRDGGAKLIGGCCGTAPDHIRAMRDFLDAPEKTVSITSPLVGNGENAVAEATPQHPTQLASRLDEGRFVIAVEMDPPKGFSTYKLIAGAQLLSDSGVDVINLADSPMARMRMSPWAACQLIQTEVGIETVLHFITRGRNILRVQGDLLASHALGVRNVFVVMGDPTAIGDYPEAMDNFDVVPSGLIKLISQGFNTGVDHTGAEIGGSTSFFVGCALNLGALDLDRETRILNKKIQSGANFALTQPVFDPTLVHRFVDHYEGRYGSLELAILVGLLPLQSSRHAAFLHNEVPGIRIPEETFHRIESSGDKSKEEGLQMCIELIEQIKDTIQGIYIMPAFGQYDIASEIVEYTRQNVVGSLIHSGVDNVDQGN